MDTMLQRIIELMGGRHGAAKSLADSIGVPANLISDWKGGRSKSYPKYAPAIAEYYGVSLDWLSGLTDYKGEKEKPLINDDEELTEYLEELRNRSEMRMLFSVSKGATKAEVEKAVAIIEALRKAEGRD